MTNLLEHIQWTPTERQLTKFCRHYSHRCPLCRECSAGIVNGFLGGPKAAAAMSHICRMYVPQLTLLMNIHRTSCSCKDVGPKRHDGVLPWPARDALSWGHYLDIVAPEHRILLTRLTAANPPSLRRTTAA